MDAAAPPRRVPCIARLRPRLLLALIACAGAGLGMRCPFPPPDTGIALFVSPQTNPIVLSPDDRTLYVANTTSGSLSIVDVSNPARPFQSAEIKVGLDPVGVAVRPKLDPADPDEDELVLVTNHMSDSISVVSRKQRAVIQTVQELVHADGLGTPDDLVSTTNEPVGIVFASSFRAFVSLDVTNEVLVLNLDAAGKVSLDPRRLSITAQAPRALAASDGRLYVAAFESGNQTELPTCAPGDNRPLDEGDDIDEGCEFHLSFNFLLGFAVQPNVGGRVARDRDHADRDLFVFDSDTLDLLEVVEGVGTLLYGMASHGDTLYVTNTEGRNQLDGLAALENRVFDNRLTLLDCSGGCALLGDPVDLDASAAPLGMTVPTPYGVAVSGDGQTLVVTAAGSDGRAGDFGGTPPGQPEIPGLVTLDGGGNVLGGLRLGAIPQGVALASAADGSAQTAYVLNTVDSTVSAVDVSDPGAPTLLATLFVGSDPTPEDVRRGRIAFSTARASTSGTFSCESCHPNGNMDQLIWTINTVNGPDEPPDPNGAVAEPRTTMPIRGLRDTLPLHWDGSLGDALPLAFVPGDAAPDCSLAGGEQECFRHLVNASLTGVMCRQLPDCPMGIAHDLDGDPTAGALTDAERDDMGRFLAAVSFPVSPKRRPSDALSATAREGMRDFFTDDDEAGLANLIPSTRTCGDRTAGCHGLPLTVSTNSPTVGRFDAPSIRGMWDRFILFSNGIVSSEEGLELGEACASGARNDTACDPTGGFFPPSGETVYDPAIGMTERGSFMASFEGLFRIVYGVPGARIWEFINEMGVGLPGLLGRQVSLDADNVSDPNVLDRIEQLEGGTRDGKIMAEASVSLLRTELYFDPDTDTWQHPQRAHMSFSSEDLEALAALGSTITFTAHLPGNVMPGGAERQPLLSPNSAEPAGTEPGLPRVPAGSGPLVRVLKADYVRFPAEGAGPRVLVDGSVCAGCSLEALLGGAFDGGDAVRVTLAPLPAAGPHTLQVLNPDGLASNELPFFVD